MIKNKKKNTIFKVCTLFVMALLCIISFVVPTKAYYQDENGNLLGNNLLVDSGNITLNESAKSFSIDLVQNQTYTFSIQNGSGSGQYALQLRNENSVVQSLTGGTSWNTSFTFTCEVDNETLFYIYANNIMNCDLMLNVGSTALTYDISGIWYNETNYNNYGAIEYGSGFAEGRDSVYESMTYQKISRLVTNTAIAKYDVNNSSMVNLVQISDISYNGDNLFLDWSANSNDNGYWYHISISWSNSYIIKSVGFTPGSWSQAILDINGFQSSNVSYNGSYFGWFEVNKIYNGGTNNIEIQFKYNGGATFEGVNIYVDAFNEFALNSQAAFNEGYEQGVNVGKAEGYSTGYSEGVNQTTTNVIGWKGLFFSMADLPFKTVSNFLGFEVLGVNLFKAFIGFITVLGILWVFKRLVK